MSRYREYGDKELVFDFIFNYPAEHQDEISELEEELERRYLMDWAEQTRREFFDMFALKWEREMSEEEEEIYWRCECGFTDEDFNVVQSHAEREHGRGAVIEKVVGGRSYPYKV